MAQVDQITVLIRGEDALSRPAAAAARSLQDVDKAAHGADRAVAAVGQTAAKQTGAVAGFASALGKIGLAGLGVQTALAGVKSVVGVFAGPVQAASDLAESMSKVDVVFGKSAPAIQEWAKTTAAAMGQSRAQALEAAGGFGNLFVSMGLAQAPAADLSKKIVTLASDLASFNNIKPEEALEKLRAGLVGEAEPLRTLGVNLNEDAVQAEALRLGLAKSKKEITDAAKIQARYSLIMKQTATAQGDFARTSTGLANSQRIIAASFADLQTQIGERFMPTIAVLVSAFAQWLPSALERLGPVLDRVGGFFVDFVDDVGIVARMLETRGFLETLKELGLRAVPVLLEGFQSVRDLAGRITGWLRTQIAAINWTQVWSTVRGVAEGLVARLGSATAAVTQWLVAQWQSINWTAVWGAVKNAGNGLVASLGSVAASVTTWLSAQWAAIDWKKVWNAVSGVADGLIAGLGPIWGSVTSWLTGQWAKIDWPAIWTSLTEHVAALEGNLEVVTEPLQRWLTRSATDVDWNAVWRDARTGPTASTALDSLWRHEDTQPVAHAMGLWLGNAALDAVDLMVQAMRNEGSPKAGAGVIAMMEIAIRNAGPGTRAAMRLYGLDVAVWIIEGVVEALTTRLGPAIQKAITDAVAKVPPIRVPSLEGFKESIGAGAPADVKPGTGSGTGSTPAFQHGGSFLVGGSGGPDSQMVAFRASPGERVDVTPPGGARGGGAVNVVVNVGEVRDRGDADHLASILPDALSRALEKARSQQGLPSVSGLFRYA